MAHPDHDQDIGRLIGARLRGPASRRHGAAPAEVHPDAELWAAYVDAGLTADEVVTLEAHLAGCPACRRLVAALAPETVAAPVTSGLEAPLAAAARVLPFPRRAVIVVMGLAASLFAAVTLWSVSRLGQPATVSEMAAGAPAPVDAPRAAPTPAPVAPAADASTSAGDATASRMGGAELRKSIASAERQGAEADALADAAARAAQADRRRLQMQANTQAAASARTIGPVPTQAAQQSTAPAGAPGQDAPAPQARAAKASPPPAGPPPAPATAAPGPAASPAPSAPVPPSPARAQSADAAVRDEREPRLGFAVAPATLAMPSFAEPSGRLWWRIRDASRLDSSSDGGATWNERHRAGRGQVLRAGTAPAIDSAWVVGDRGLVLRLSVPGGWTVVSPPATVPLIGVTATGAQSARVTAADGRVFETADGGATWTPVTPAGGPQ